MSMLLLPLVFGAGAVGVYYLTRKNRGKKHSSRRNRSSTRSTRGGMNMNRMGMGPRPMAPGSNSSGIKPNLKGGKRSRRSKRGGKINMNSGFVPPKFNLPKW